ncbi:MAG: cell division protein FtsQ/DivIB [Pseudomonadota bacterium]
MTGFDRFIRWSAGLTLALVVSLTGYAVLRGSDIEALAIRWIDVTGTFERVTAEQVRSAAAPHLETGFIAADPLAVRLAVEALPWVRRAEVTKDWPDTVEISVTEHHPLAIWDDGRLLSETGRLFDVDDTMVPQGLPLLSGPEDLAVEIVVFYQEMQRRLAGTGFDVRRLARSDRGGWQAELSDRVTLILGSVDPLPRLARFLVALPHLESMPGQELAGVDLRYGNGFAVRWRESPADGTAPVVEQEMIVARHEG